MAKKTFVRRKLTPEEQYGAEQLAKIWETKKHELDVTQKEAAEALGWTQSNFSGYINGHLPLGVETTLRIAEFFTVDPLDIRPDYEELFSVISDYRPSKRIQVNGYLDELNTKIGVLPFFTDNKKTSALIVNSDDYAPTYFAHDVIVFEHAPRSAIKPDTHVITINDDDTTKIMIFDSYDQQSQACVLRTLDNASKTLVDHDSTIRINPIICKSHLNSIIRD